MKKTVAIIISLMFIMCLASCSNKAENPTVTDTQATDTIPSASVSVSAVDSVTFRAVFGENEETPLNPENSAYIRNIINGKWNTDGTSDCMSDVVFTVDGKNYYYHVSCSTFNDYATEQNLKLTKSQAGRINDMLGPLGYLYGEDEAVDLAVKINSGKVIYGENFVLTASATNNTGKTIYVSLPTGTPDMHFEIDVVIEDENGRRFVDLDTQGKAYTCDMKTISVKNGETITQVMNMSPGYLIDGSMYPLGEEINYFPAGTYNGTATIIWCDSFDPETFEYGTQHRKIIEFNVPVYEIKNDTAESFEWHTADS